jgi:hypothetical protein
VKEGKSKDTKLRGLKDTNEDISISQETELKGTRQNSVKRYKETPVKLYTGRKTPVKSVHWRRKTPVQRHKKNPSPQVKRYKEESRLKGANQNLCNSSYTSLPPPHKII